MRTCYDYDYDCRWSEARDCPSEVNFYCLLLEFTSMLVFLIILSCFDEALVTLTRLLQTYKEMNKVNPT